MPSPSPRLAVLAHASLLDRGGYARRALDCATALTRAFPGAAVTVLSVESPTRRRDATATREVAAACTRVGATLDVIPGFPRRRGLVRIADGLARRAVRRRLRALGADLVHAHGPRAGATARTAADGTACRVVVDVHGDRAAEGRLERGEADSLATPPDPAEAAIPARAHGVIHASAALAARFPAKAGAPSGVVPCLVDPARIPDDTRAETLRAEGRRALGLTGDEWIVAYAGSLAVWQELPRTLAAVRHLVERVPPLRFLVLTPDAAEATRRLDAAGLPRGTFLVESPASEDVVSRLCLADAGVLWRRPCVANTVAFPTKAAEYLAAGLALATTDAVDALATLVREAPVAGFALPWSSEDEVLAARLAGIARPSSPAERAARRALARTRLSLDAALPVYRQVHGALLDR